MRRPFYYWLTILILFQAEYGFAKDIEEKILTTVIDKGIIVDLKEPYYCDGVISTTQGGVITAPDVRIQAQQITYTKKKNEKGELIAHVVAEGDLILEMGQVVFIGQRLEYDFIANNGFIYEGRTAIEPWFFGGRVIELCADGNYLIYDGFITTAENDAMDWQIKAETVCITPQYLINAQNVYFQLFKFNALWLPSFRADLNSIFDSPIRYNVQWGGRRTLVGLTYELYSTKCFKSFLRFDYHLKRGFGGGIETHYLSEDRKEYFDSINYYAKDISLSYPTAKTRFRFQGLYHKSLLDDRLSIDLTYDKLSDKDMATDYNDRGLDINTAERTQLHVRRQEDFWIANFLTRLRINNFQTIKQELPSLETCFKPVTVWQTGLITENFLKTSYLDFAYSRTSYNVHDYNSTRHEYVNRNYRPIPFKYAKLTPEIGTVIIHYGNSPSKNPKDLVLGTFAVEGQTAIHRYYGPFIKHVIKPYGRYDYLTSPTVSPDDHYIFDIDDGWYRLNQLRTGIIQTLYAKSSAGCVRRLIETDLYIYSFFSSPTFKTSIPKTYLDILWQSFPTLRHRYEIAWDNLRQKWDHFNFRTEWTIDADTALTLEYRHRDAYDWRKALRYNFLLDSYRSVEELRHSALSDRRDTLLINFFYRFHPNWAFHLGSRHGWNRSREPAYNEYEIDFLTTIQTAWKAKFSYQKKENDHRFAIYFSLGINKPNQSNNSGPRCLDF